MRGRSACWSCRILIFIALFLCLLAVTTRRLLVVFLGAMALLIAFIVAGALTSDCKYDTIARLIDPFGGRAVGRAMRYWSATSATRWYLPSMACCC